MATVRQGGTKLRGNPIEVVGEELKPGQKAPDFSLVDAQNMSDVKLSDTSGKTRIVSVVTSLDTGVCAAETKHWEEEASKLPGGGEIITVSMDLPFAQKRWASENGVSHRILSSYHDEKFGEEWGVLIKAPPLRRLLQRSVFVLDKDNTIRYVEYCAENSEPPDIDRALQEAARIA